ncbi:MAG: sigma-54 dependent transcriptional regulator [bacterium]|nr:sigma-54 dependent transcriptional regulator [bacterium]
MQGKKLNILVVDDERVHRYTLCSLFADWGWECSEADDGVAAVAAVQSQPFDAILMDVRMARMDGMEALRRIRAINPAIPVIIMTAFSSVDSAVAAIKQGAQDYLTKPLDFERLRTTMEVAMGHRRPEEKKAPQGLAISADMKMIGQSQPMLELWQMIAQVAPTTATVLITGESGTGKELVASALHHKSERADGPFIKINCAALTETLLESELFGHERGAFTGADRRREGRFVQAHGGTLFLDEIGETSAAMQVKLLRALQEHEVQRVGGQETIRVDARILAATNRNLEEAVQSGMFREDLFYRLKVVELEVPPLRERQGDIPLLTNYFVDKFARQNKREVKGFTPDCMDLFNRYPWPGNVRELEHAIERGVILMRGDYLDISVLPMALQRWAGLYEEVPVEEPATLKEAEKALILKTLEETGGNRSEAARRLEITRKTLLNKLKSYDIA